MNWATETAIALLIAAIIISVLSKLRVRRRRAVPSEAEPVEGVEPLFHVTPPELTAVTRVTLLRTAPTPPEARAQQGAAPPPAVAAPEPASAPEPVAAPAEGGAERDAAAEEGITVDGRPLTPAQYRWLFPDLASLPEADAPILRHFRNSGRDEIARKIRAIPAKRLLALDLQRLAPTAPEAAPSPFWRYIPGTSGTLNIICSHDASAGEFGSTIPQTGSPDAQLYLRPDGHDYFQRGVPGLATTIEETARWLEAVIAHLGPTRLRVVGFGAGAYGALLFGHLLSADAITAAAPEFVLGRPQYRSHLRYEARSYHPVYRDLRPFLAAMAPRLALLTPAYDPMDFRAVQEARAAGLANMAMSADFHPAENGVDMAAILAGPEALVPLERINLHPYADPFEDATVEQLAAAYEALAERDYARSTGLLRSATEAHPRNHGLFCHIGIQQALMGDVAAGEATIQAARQAMVRDFPDGYGERLARFGRTLVGDFYRPDPTLLRRLEAAFDTDPVPAA